VRKGHLHPVEQKNKSEHRKESASKEDLQAVKHKERNKLGQRKDSKQRAHTHYYRRVKNKLLYKESKQVRGTYTL
jgi:hypothetical protein